MHDKEKPFILLVDDKTENLLALESLLEDLGLTVVKATSGDAALALMLAYDFALVLLDVQMPDMDGFETAKLMRGSERTRHTPLIFVTARSKDQEHIFRGYESGAVDYISKPIEPAVLRNKVKVFVDLYRHKKSLEDTSRELRKSLEEQKRINEKLRLANKKILEQHKSVIEEERLKVLLQLAGATAHEINQPLMALLGNIELMRLNEGRPAKFSGYMNMVEEAGQKISDIVRKISNIHQDSTLPYAGGSLIINLDQDIRILVFTAEKDFDSIKKLLKAHKKIKLDWIQNCSDALHLLNKDDYQLVFVDYVLPDNNSNGIDFIRSIREKQIDVPAVVITAHGNEMIASQAIQEGAYDYLSKEMVSEKFLSRSINNALAKFSLRMELKAAREKMAEMSIKDELTGLYNRRYFLEVLDREMARAKRYDLPLALGMIDLDYFKRINDTYGHTAGDMVLAETGKMLKDQIRQSDLACRYGGEEFAVVLPDTDPANAFVICERFREMALQQSFTYSGSRFSVTLSVGISHFNPNLDQFPAAFIEKADQALYQAKHDGRNRVVIYSNRRPSLPESLANSPA